MDPTKMQRAPSQNNPEAASTLRQALAQNVQSGIVAAELATQTFVLPPDNTNDRQQRVINLVSKSWPANHLSLHSFHVPGTWLSDVC